MISQNLNQQTPSPISKHNFRPRSTTVKNEQSQAISLKRLKLNNKNDLDLKAQSHKKFVSPSQKTFSCISSPKPLAVKSLLSENKKLRDEIMLLQQLIQEVVPVFSKITEDCDDDGQSINIQLNTKSSFNDNMTVKKFNIKEVSMLQQSLQQLKLAYDQKHIQGKNQDESEFLEAEDLDMTTTDERSLNPKRFQNMKSSFPTFGEKDDSEINFRLNSEPQLQQQQTGQKLNCNTGQKTKISDLNKQSKNYNMPINIDLKKTKKSIINYEEIQQLKGMIDKINDTDILKELKSSKKIDETKNSFKRVINTESRNQILESNYSSANISGESSISDDDASIPTDSLITKNLVSNHHTSRTGAIKELNSQPFNKLSMINLQFLKKNNANQRPQSKMNLIYPRNIPQTTENFNSCNSIDSNDDFGNVLYADIQSKSLETYQSQGQKVECQEQPKAEIKILSENKIEQIIQTQQMQEDNQPIKQNPIDNKIEQYASISDNEKYAHQIREVNFDNQKDLTSQLEDNIVDYDFQSQSKDCFMFTQSVVITEQKQVNSKRGSIDPMLQLFMLNQSPLKEKDIQDSIQQSERRDIANALDLDETKKLFKSISSDCQIKSRLSNQQRDISRKSSSKKDKENNHQANTNEKFNSCQRPKLDDSTPALQILNVLQQDKPSLNCSLKSQNTKSVQLRKSISGKSSNNNSPQSKKQQAIQIVPKKRGQSSSHYKNEPHITKDLHVLKVIKKEKKLKTKWQTLEEKELNLANLNQLILRSQESHRSNELKQTNLVNVLHISPVAKSNTMQVNQHNGQQAEETQELIDLSSFNMTLTNQLFSEKALQRTSIIEQANNRCSQELVIQSFSIQPIINVQHSQSDSQKISEIVEIIKESVNQEISFNQTFNAFNNNILNNDQQISCSNVSDKPLTQVDCQQQQEAQCRDKFIQEYKNHQKVQIMNELDRLCTPSPRNLKEILQESQNPIQSIPQLSDNIQSFDDTKVQEESSINDDLCDLSVNEAQGDTYNIRDYTTPSSETYKSQQLDNLLIEYMIDHGHKNLERNSTQSVSRSQTRSISPYQQIAALQSSEELIEISAPDLNDEVNRKTFLSQTSHSKSQNVYEYSNGKDIHEEQDQKRNYVIQETNITQKLEDIVIRPLYGQISEKYQSRRNSLNTVINEEPSIEEQESNIINPVKKALQNSESLISDTYSKISITQIDMAESEMFSPPPSNKSIRRESIQRQPLSNQSSNIQDYYQTGNYSSGKYKTPLKQFINNGTQSAKKFSTQKADQQYYILSQPYQNDVTKSQQFLPSKNPLIIPTTLLSPILKQDRSASKSPLRPKDININKNQVHSENENDKQKLARQKSECLYLYKMEQLKEKVDIKLGKVEILQEPYTDCKIRQSSLTKLNSHQTVRVSQSIFNLALNTKSLIVQDIKQSTSSVIQRKALKAQSRQKELETKLQEKEERIKTIIQKKRDIDEKISEQRQVREMSNNNETYKSSRQESQLSLTRGSLIVRTPSKILNQKLLIKRDSVQSNIKTSKKQPCILSSIMNNEDKTFKTLDVKTQYRMPKEIQNSTDINADTIENQNISGPQSERFCTINQRENYSPMIMKLQPTLKQKEFFQKIESDCQQRKLQKIQSVAEKMTVSKVKQHTIML